MNTFCHISLLNATEHLWWKVSIVSSNGMVPSGNKPLLEPINPDLCHHMASLAHNELKTPVVSICQILGVTGATGNLNLEIKNFISCNLDLLIIFFLNLLALYSYYSFHHFGIHLLIWSLYDCINPIPYKIDIGYWYILCMIISFLLWWRMIYFSTCIADNL